MSVELKKMICTARMLTQDEREQLARDDPDLTKVCRENSEAAEEILVRSRAGQRFIEAAYDHVPGKSFEKGLPLVRGDEFVA